MSDQVLETTMSPGAIPAVPTGAAGDQELVMGADVAGRKAGWERMINDYLINWGRDPAALESDEVIAPTPDIISLAGDVAMALRDKGIDPPLRVVPDGDGGVCFEHRHGEFLETLTVASDGTVELLVFRNCRLETRRSLA